MSITIFKLIQYVRYTHRNLGRNLQYWLHCTWNMSFKNTPHLNKGLHHKIPVQERHPGLLHQLPSPLPILINTWLKFINLKRKILDCSIPAVQQPDKNKICAFQGWLSCPTKITLWASTCWSSSQARVTSAKSLPSQVSKIPTLPLILTEYFIWKLEEAPPKHNLSLPIMQYYYHYYCLFCFEFWVFGLWWVGWRENRGSRGRFSNHCQMSLWKDSERKGV